MRAPAVRIALVSSLVAFAATTAVGAQQDGKSYLPPASEQSKATLSKAERPHREATRHHKAKRVKVAHRHRYARDRYADDDSGIPVIGMFFDMFD